MMRSPSAGSSCRASTTVGLRQGRIVWLLLLLLAGCRPAEGRLRVGANLWPGYEPLYLAQRDGLFDEGEFQVVRLASAEQVISAFRNRALDVAAVTGDEAVRVASRLPGARIILVCDYSNGADAVVARPDIRSLAELKGKRVGLESSALGAYFLALTLEVAGLTPADITAVPVSVASQEEAFRVGQVDALVTFDPVRSRLLGQGAKSLFDSSRTPGKIVDVLIARPEALEHRRPALLRLVQGWFSARERLQSGAPATLSAAAAHQGLSVRELVDSLKLIELPDLVTNRRLLSGAANGLPTTLRQVSAELVRHQFMDRTVDPDLLIDATLVEGGGRK